MKKFFYSIMVCVQPFIFYDIFFISSIMPIYIFFIYIIIIGFVCYFIQYFKCDYFYFNEYKDSITHSIGHFISSFPIAISAFICNSINIIKITEYYGYIHLSLIFIILITIFLVGSTNTYNGIEKNIFAIFAFLGFYLFPLNKYLNNKIKNIIIKLTSYTNGIYCLHIIIKFYFFKCFKMSITILSCLEVYIICYIISCFGEKIFRKNKFKNLFI